MYKQASKLKLRFETSKGMLTTEQLWDLSLTDLDKLAVSLERKAKATSAKTFLEVKTEEDEIAKLRFDIALDILQTKVKEDAMARNAANDKEHNQKILAIIAKKQEDALEGKSVEELQAMLK